VFDGPVGGVDPGVGSPEAARAYRSALDPDPPPGPVDPSDRPGCLRAGFSLLVVAIVLFAILWLGGELLGPA
jgi:hypothetical protein